MQRVQLYIADNEDKLQLVDLFGNETIQLTSSIQDIKDIGSVFTDFSQTFVVPASDTNNKIFRHYYNFYITGNAFDSRKKKRAEIRINYSPFRKGKIYLNSVNMKVNKPYSYELIFYGNTVSLKDLIGDDELTDLDLSAYNHSYSETNVRTGLTTGLDLNGETASIIYPLITSKKRLFFNSNPASDFFNSSGNLFHDESLSPPGDPLRGLEYTDLKPAIKAMHIIEAIEYKYEIRFTRDFFSESNDAFSNLYFWINSKKGEYNDVDDDEDFAFSYKVTGYTSSDPSNLVTVDGTQLTVNMVKDVEYDFKLDVTVSDQTVDYDIVLKNITKGREYKTSTSGDTDVAIDILDVAVTSFDVFEWEIRSRGELTVLSAEFKIAYAFPLQTPIEKTYDTSTNQTTTFDIVLEEKLPKMKVIDFLTGLFKMFNLTAYYIDDINDSDYNLDNKDTIYVDTLDNFYLDAVNNPLKGTIDIQEYMDVTEHTVSSVLPFTDINFKYQETDTILMDHHFEQFNEVFGNAEFNVREATRDNDGNITIDRGTKYDIQLPFSHFKYERLVDTAETLGANDTKDTLIQWGYSAGGEFDSETPATGAPIGDYDTVMVEPLLFYAIKVDPLPGASADYSSRGGKINYISTTNPTGLTSYYRPSNSSDQGNTTTPPSHSLNFDSEVDEWQGVNYGDRTNSLYKSFYKNYVESVFNPLKRMFKVTAHLPTRIVINYRLNDQIKIGDKMFRINSITTDLSTGKSELELLNIFSNEVI